MHSSWDWLVVICKLKVAAAAANESPKIKMNKQVERWFWLFRQTKSVFGLFNVPNEHPHPSDVSCKHLECKKKEKKKKIKRKRKRKSCTFFCFWNWIDLQTIKSIQSAHKHRIRKSNDEHSQKDSSVWNADWTLRKGVRDLTIDKQKTTKFKEKTVYLNYLASKRKEA